MLFDSKRSQAESFRDAERAERCATSSTKKSMRLKKTIPKKRIRYNESSMNRRVARKLAKCYQNFAKEYNEFKLLDQIFSSISIESPLKFSVNANHFCLSTVPFN